VKPNHEEKSMPSQDDYSMVEQQVQKMQQARATQQQYAPEIQLILHIYFFLILILQI